MQFLTSKKNLICNGIVCVFAWLAVYGMCYVSTFFAADYVSYGMVSLLMFAVMFVLLRNTFENLKQLAETADRKKLIKRVLYATALALFVAAAVIMGYQLRVWGMSESGFAGKMRLIKNAFCLMFALLPFTNYLFAWFEKVQASCKEAAGCKTENNAREKQNRPWSSKKVFFITWAAIFICWIPVFLAYYPAVMAYDFHRQSIEAAKGFIWFNNYQPLAHTWLIWVAFQIGNAVGSLEVGMACYSIFQMLVLSVACAYSCNLVYRLTKKKWPIIVMVLFFGFFPLISVLSVGVTKDVLFSALFLVFLCIFVERTFFATGKRQWILDACWFVEGCVMMLYRNNAVYAVAVFAVVALLLAEKKQRLRLFALCLLLAIGGKGSLEGVQLWIGTEGRGSKVEMYSVPLQQFARVGYYHGEELDEETFALLDKYMPEEYWSRYNPPLSDGVKHPIAAKGTFDEVWKDDIGGMLKAWAKIGLKYPNEYIDAFLLLNSGYWFFDDVTWAEVFGSGVEIKTGALSTYTSSTSEAIPEGIEHISKFPWLEGKLSEIVNANEFYYWPVVSNLFKPALYCWALLLTAIACIYANDKKKTMVVLLPLVYLATMFLGPVVQVRYVLPIMMVIPLMAAVWARKEETIAFMEDECIDKEKVKEEV